ncbi:MAG TPA: efflux RND transporter permease subunit [Kiritimatiellia bacterium]|nr:efflux RND transporter permease subunit [Kiritimatiellia bacterium]HMO99039.1 efflux RND transporter permease subunit [Kiritimatiellia bacterium]HMP96115.1 efflux RND transporter permease subunit [Kiritimatiellia bacterium]
MTIINSLLRFCLVNKLVVFLLAAFLVVWGILHAPFDWQILRELRDPVPVDAIPDIGENQQIVFADWMGRSPQDMEDQVTYPLTTALLGVPQVKTVRSISMFGFSMIFVIFDESAEFYWSRARILEKLSSLPAGTLPEGVQPMLGPDATALGQVFWYTLEGRDPEGQPVGGWDLQELRSIQDFTVKYALQSAEGVSEVASIGGYVKEYQVDVDPDAMRFFGVTLMEVVDAVRQSNLDVGANVMEINQVEYSVRGVGFIKSLADLEQAVVKVVDAVPVYLGQVASVGLGPQFRRGALDKEGTEAVGGVVVVRYKENPLAAIQNVKRKIDEIALALPRKVLEDGTVSQVTIVPFYDRTDVIYETLGTLNRALYAQMLVTSIVVLVMVRHFASSVLIALVMPLTVLGCFIAMRRFGVDANLVSLAGIAIAIGTIVDMGIIVCENILRHLDEEGGAARSLAAGTHRQRRLEIIQKAVSEVSGAVVTAIATTMVSFLAVFTMEAAEGKLFKPLAFTKTFVLLGSVVVALTILPAMAHLVCRRSDRRLSGGRGAGWMAYFAAGALALLLAYDWMPLGPDLGLLRNAFLVALLVGLVLGLLLLYQRFYPSILGWCLDHKKSFLALPAFLVVLGVLVWIGFPRMSAWLPAPFKQWKPVAALYHAFPGLGREFMPPLDEGAFLYMPSAMPHAGLNEVLDLMQIQDMAFYGIPEVDLAVGKLGRAESPLDPAPVPMVETVINYRPEFLTDAAGRRITFRYDPQGVDFFRDSAGNPLHAPDGEPYYVRGRFERDDAGLLIPDRRGHPFRQWRPALDPELNEGRTAWAGIQSPRDIWDEIVRVGDVPGMTSAPWLQPISARIVMLQSGMRAPMGLKVRGPSLEAIESAALLLEQALKEVPSINPATVIADRIVGKPYLEIHPDRGALARYGITVAAFQDVLEVAVGGKEVTRTVEGRERYPVRVRYARERRDAIEELERIFVPAMGGAQVPLGQLADIRYVRGPEMIKGEDTQLIGYVLFDKQPGFAEVDVVESARDYLASKFAAGELDLPAGISYVFAGSYENQLRAARKLAMVVPLSLFIIFLILYLQFRRVAVTLFVFGGIFLAWSGGFILIWLYAQSWFLDVTLFGLNLRHLFGVHAINLSVAVWVGFLALFGIATDDGVVMCSYLNQRFEGANLRTRTDIRRATLEAGMRRIRPCMMTTATTILALIPVLSATGRGSDLMIPMAIPSFGGMLIQVLTTLLAPVLYCAWKERTVRVDRIGDIECVAE